jgi:protein-disulfide isomerase
MAPPPVPSRARALAAPVAVLLAVLVACSSDAKSGASGAGESVLPQNAAAQQARGAPMSDSLIAVRADQGRIIGQANAPLWIVEVSDFQCPFCKTWHDSTYPAILAEYVNTGKVRLAYLNFPLNIHPNAKPAAEAAMCASAQGKFFEMHDAIFATQRRWAQLSDASAVWDSLATAVRVDVPAWRDCMKRDATLPLIDADYERASSGGVRSTPSFYIGDEGIAGAEPMATFRQAIERQLAKKRGGTAPPAR